MKLTNVWSPSQNPALDRFFNSIDEGEESDINESGELKRPFKMYLKAMGLMGAFIGDIVAFVNLIVKKNQSIKDLNKCKMMKMRRFLKNFHSK